MDHRTTFRRIVEALDQGSYLTPTRGVPDDDRAAVAEVAELLHDDVVEPDRVRLRIHQLHAAGRLSHGTKLSALGVLAASPRVRDFAEASRLAGQQELVALDARGPDRDRQLASADRHRGVLAFLMGHPQVALDWFGRAFERERSAENLGNVLAALLKLGRLAEASSLYAQATCRLEPAVAEDLRARVRDDLDLAALRGAA